MRARRGGSGFDKIASLLSFVVADADFAEGIAAGSRSPLRLRYIMARRTGSVVVIDAKLVRSAGLVAGVEVGHPGHGDTSPSPPKTDISSHRSATQTTGLTAYAQNSAKGIRRCGCGPPLLAFAIRTCAGEILREGGINHDSMRAAFENNRRKPEGLCVLRARSNL